MDGEDTGTDSVLDMGSVTHGMVVGGSFGYSDTFLLRYI